MPSPYSSSAVAVNPSVLEGCGQTAQHLGGQIPPETAKIAEPNDQAASTLQGWLTGPAIHNCAANWKTLLDKLAGDMGSAGAKLTTTATAYRQNEQNVSVSMSGNTDNGTHRPSVKDPFNTVLTSDLSPAAEARRAAGAGKAQ
ncbi:WXG100 family type VII secretion target [Kitasatospora sp. NPDC048286]|uniref:WXG100 family type VII secretion target n=1 Tax=unclassified Kitasatospora TaxID=2633591 RepID=UPI00371CCAD7